MYILHAEGLYLQDDGHKKKASVLYTTYTKQNCYANLTYWWLFKGESIDEFMYSPSTSTTNKDNGIMFACIHCITHYISVIDKQS